MYRERKTVISVDYKDRTYNLVGEYSKDPGSLIGNHMRFILDLQPIISANLEGKDFNEIMRRAYEKFTEWMNFVKEVRQDV